MKRFSLPVVIVVLILALAACAQATSTAPAAEPVNLTNARTSPQAQPAKSAEAGPTAAPVIAEPAAPTRPVSRPTHPATPEPDAAPAGTPTPRPTLRPDEWKKLPVIPTVSDGIIQTYLRGQELGNNPRAFSKIGDCGSTPAWFLGDFDRGPRYYNLGEYQSLGAVIQEFQGSFDRTSLAARSGFNASALFTPLWSDRTFCNAGEAPLECEYRVHKPALAFIMLGTNDVWRPKEFEPQMRKTIEYSLQNGVIPILATKADNQEGDGSINATIAKLALEYDIPLWNYWAAVDALPNHGLQEDGAHLTWGPNTFDVPEAMTKAWPVRNLTALQVLDAVWQKLNAAAPERP